MNGKKIGYVRVSSEDQNSSRQLEGVVVDRLFVDRASGGSVHREQLTALLDYAREGDVVVVHSLDRLARNLDDLRRLVWRLTDAGIRVEFVKEGLVFNGDDAPMSRLLLSMIGAFAEFERSLIRERQREGIAIAKARGAYKGRKKALTRQEAMELGMRAKAGERKTQLALAFGISRETLYRYIKTENLVSLPS